MLVTNKLLEAETFLRS